MSEREQLGSPSAHQARTGWLGRRRAPLSLPTRGPAEAPTTRKRQKQRLSPARHPSNGKVTPGRGGRGTAGRARPSGRQEPLLPGKDAEEWHGHPSPGKAPYLPWCRRLHGTALQATRLQLHSLPVLSPRRIIYGQAEPKRRGVASGGDQKENGHRIAGGRGRGRDSVA